MNGTHLGRQLYLLAAMIGGLATVPASAEGPPIFEKDVRPILKAQCFHCHGEEGRPKGGLDLRLVRRMIEGGESGPAIEPGGHEASLLWEKVAEDAMPPGEKKLSAREKAILADWIDGGANTARPEPESIAEGVELTEEERSFWSFRPVVRPDVPTPRDPAMSRTPIDAFLLTALEEKGLGFAPEADRRTLIRRLSFDLIGGPPTPEEVATFEADDRPDAYERLVDRLLASPRYGERWGRHWLDVAGYADSDGVSAKDPVRPWAYKYRDYVVRSFNADKGLDRMIVEQLAGDELVAPPYETTRTADEIDALIATGFLRMAPDGTGDGPDDPVIARNDVVAETVKIVSTSLLGLTVGCAQCHAHRYDPISHEDYYRFRAVFEPALDVSKWKTPAQRLVSLWTATDRAKAAAADAEIKRLENAREVELRHLVESTLEKELTVAPEDLHAALREARLAPRGKRTDAQKELLKTYPRVDVTTGNVSLYDAKSHKAVMDSWAPLIAEARKARPAEDAAHALTEVPGQVPATRLFARGDPKQPKQELAPGELAVIAANVGSPEIPADDPSVPTTGRRLAYARHLTDGRHPLVARVLVNRAWMHHFGRGLVGSPGDFGALGERPTHPELLDWLASEFVREGWSLKWLHRRIVGSTAYRQSSRRDPAKEAADPENRLLGRMSVRRLEAEAVRDAILAASGRLNPAMYGPPVPVSVDESSQVVVGLIERDDAGRQTGKRTSIGAEEFRRGLYLQARRSLPVSFLEAFDAAVPSPNCEKRTASTVAPQALMLMNNAFVLGMAADFAGRVSREAGDDPEARTRLAWSLAFGGPPDAGQLAEALAFVEALRADFEAADAALSEEARKKAPPAPADLQALAAFCQALIGSNGFLYVD